jgi:chromatin modification-related protein EAF6
MSDRDVTTARQRVERKEALRQGLQGLERQIFALETAYLEDTPAGNVVQGFDNYAANARKSLPRKKVMDSERIFSLSSTTSASNTPLIDNGDDIEDE